MEKELIKEVIREMVRDGELQVGWSDERHYRDNIVLTAKDKDGTLIQELELGAGIEVVSCNCRCR